MDIENKARRRHFNHDSAKKGRSAGSRRCKRAGNRRARRQTDAILIGGKAR